MHLSCCLKKMILQIKIAVIRTFGILCGLFYECSVSNDKRKSRHCHQPFLRRCHTKVYIVALHINGTHRVGRCRIHCKHSAVLMRQRADFADWIQDARSGLIVRRVDKCNIWIFPQDCLYLLQIRQRIHRKSQFYHRQAIVFADFRCSCAVSAIVDDKHLLPLRQQGVQTDIYIDRA